MCFVCIGFLAYAVTYLVTAYTVVYGFQLSAPSLPFYILASRIVTTGLYSALFEVQFLLCPVPPTLGSVLRFKVHY